MADFAHRGIVEGFYGEPWSHEDRLWLVDRLAAWDMNTYVHAPKDDPLHRAEWRTPYPDAAMGEFEELVGSGADGGVRVGFAISPGLSIEYSKAVDVAALCQKFTRFRGLGARFFCLALDDVPDRLVHEPDRDAFASLAAAHVALAHAVADAVGNDATLWLVPTDYLGTAPTDYLVEMGETLHPDIEVGWTGRTVVSPTIRSDEARARAETLRRRLLLWDNYPVADGPMRPMLHLGPYGGRDADLAEHVSGALLNPMQHARASAVALRTAADYLRDPQAYDAEESWGRAVGESGAGAIEAFADFAMAHRYSALAPDERDPELEDAWDYLRWSIDQGGDPMAELSEVRRLLDRRVAAAESLGRDLADAALLREIEPWIEAHAAETARMSAAIDCLAKLASATEPLARALAFFGFEGRLTRTPPAAVASYGPRRVVYPQLVSMSAASAGFGPDPVLHRDRCLSDEVVALVERVAVRSLRVES